MTQRRNWWLLIGLAIVFVAGLSLLERFVRRPTRSSPTAGESGGRLSLETPELRELEDGVIEIRLDTFRRTRIRVEDEDERQALFDCLSRGFDRAFGEGVDGWDRRRLQRETQRVQEECMDRAGLSVPVPPLPGGARRE